MLRDGCAWTRHAGPRRNDADLPSLPTSDSRESCETVVPLYTGSKTAAFYAHKSILMLVRLRSRLAQANLRPNGLNITQQRTVSSDPRPRTIFSGIQPTGVPHLGNYLGALRQWVKLQDEAASDDVLIYSIVDLHAITVHQNPENLRRCKRESLATLLAIGLDPKRSTIFYQSSVCDLM